MGQVGHLLVMHIVMGIGVVVMLLCSNSIASEKLGVFALVISYAVAGIYVFIFAASSRKRLSNLMVSVIFSIVTAGYWFLTNKWLAL